MTEPNQITKFHEETDTFQLSVFLLEDKLSITLKDLVDKITYSKEYSEEDIGKEIHRKMDLTDIFTAFVNTKEGN